MLILHTKYLKLHSLFAFFCLFSPTSLVPCITSVRTVFFSSVFSCFHFFLQLSLLCIHQDENGQASWLYLKRHTYQPPTPICHFPFDWNMAPVSALAEYIILSRFIRVWLCCHCYHAAARVRKGLSGYSSHYWLLNLVMVVKALPVPFASEVSWWPALWACSTVHRYRGTIHVPFPSMLYPRGMMTG